MSSVSTDFTMYFKNKQRLDFVFSGLQLHHYKDTAACADYFKSESKELYELLKTGSMEFTSLNVADDCLITGAIEGGTITYNSDVFFIEMASIGCDLSVVNNFHDSVGETESYAYNGTKRVKSTEVLTKLKKISPTVAFKSALATGKSKEACELIESGINPDILIEGRPAIEYAAWKELPSVVKALVKKGADVNAISPDKAIVDSMYHHQFSMTALHHTVQLGSLSSLKFLLKNGANPNQKNSRGWTIFESCMEYYDDSFDKVIALIDSGVDLELRGEEEGKTAFLSAASHSFCEEEMEDEDDTSKLDILKHLVKNNADIHATCKYGGNVIWYASIDNSEPIIKYLNSIGVSDKIIPSNAYNENILENLETSIFHKDYTYFNNKIIEISDRKEKIELFQSALISDDIVIAKVLIKEGIGPLDISHEHGETLIDLANDYESYNILQLFKKCS